MRYEIHPGAEGEYQEAFVYYGTRRPESGLDFEAEFESLIGRICEAPRMYPVAYQPNIRRALMGGNFPYSIYFREIEGGIAVVALTHHSRRPGYWLDRV